MGKDLNLVMRDYHRIVMIVSWGVLGDLAVINNRYLRYNKTFNKYYLAIHLGLFMITLAIMTASIISMLATWDVIGKLKKDARLVEFRLHIIIGIVHYLLLIGNMIGGLINRTKMVNSQYLFQQIKQIVKTKYFHQINGWLIYFLAKIQYIIGNLTNLKKTHIDYEILILFIIELLLIVLIEITVKQKWIRLYSIKENSYQNVTTNGQQQALVQEVQNNQSKEVLLNDIRFENMKWCFFRNHILDITGLQHPGGQSLIEYVKGRDMARFIFGSYQVENFYQFDSSNTFNNQHSELALELLDSYKIGSIYQNYQDHILVYENQQEIDEPLNNQELLNHRVNEMFWDDLYSNCQVWTLDSKVQVSADIYKYVFKHDLCRVRNVYQVDKFGKHFEIQMMNNSKVRLYTTILSQAQENVQFREQISKTDDSEQLLSLYKKHEQLKEIQELPFIIKNYNFKEGISYQLSQLDRDDKVKIRGNYGKGLELQENEKGQSVVLCAGTGVLPFLDLLDYLYRKYKAPSQLKHTFKLNDLQLQFFASFNSEDDFLGKDIIIGLHEVLKQKQRNDVFDLKLKFFIGLKENKKGWPIVASNFDINFIKQNVNLKAKKVFVCGPPMFNTQIYTSLIELGYNHNSISFV